MAYVLAAVVLTWIVARSAGRDETSELRDMRVPAPESLAPEVRAILQKRMQRHGVSAYGLVAAAVRVDYDDVIRTASEIADEPQLAKTEDHDAAVLNALLPPRFFELQHELAMSAAALAEAATRADAEATSRALGRTMQACFACHAVYRSSRR